jgi:DNA-binding transcriptional LysR family regulator
MLDIKRLRLLRELEDRQTIAAVAEALWLSPSAVSQQLAKLERETGAQLLERVGRGVRLTPTARAILGHVDRALGELREVETILVGRTDEPRGTVRLTTFQSAGLALVPPALDILEREASRVSVEVIEAEPEVALPALLAGDVDLALADDYPTSPRAPDSRIHRHELFPDAIVLALPADDPLARSGDPVPLRALVDAPWAFTLDDSFYADLVKKLCSELAGFDPQVRHRANDLTVLLALVAGGHAVALVPELIAAGQTGIAARPIAEQPLHRTVFVAARASSAAHPALAAVRDALIRAAPTARARAAVPVA